MHQHWYSNDPHKLQWVATTSSSAFFTLGWGQTSMIMCTSIKRTKSMPCDKPLATPCGKLHYKNMRSMELTFRLERWEIIVITLIEQWSTVPVRTIWDRIAIPQPQHFRSSPLLSSLAATAYQQHTFNSWEHDLCVPPHEVYCPGLLHVTRPRSKSRLLIDLASSRDTYFTHSDLIIY